MHYEHLGRSGLRVSRLILGTMNFGMTADQAQSFAVMDAALEAGVVTFDTADVYGGPQTPDMEQGYGTSEEIIGRWLEQGGHRDEVTLATKVFQPMDTGPNARGLSAQKIRRSCEASLRRLQTDHIDLYQMHHVDRSTPWEEIWQAMEQLVQEGKVLYVGSSNFAGWDIAVAQAAARERHFLGLVSEQSLYNLTARTVELEVLPSARHHGVGVIPWSPLASGLLGGVLKKAAGEGRRSGAGIAGVPDQVEEMRPQLEAYEALCDELGEQPSDVALAWLLHQPGVPAVVSGPRLPEQLTSSLRALEVQLDADALQRLDDIFPGPGGAAPEAYAW